jgi:hypothetical protein
VELPIGLVVDVPAGWNVDPTFGAINRATQGYVRAGNGPLTGLGTVPGNGDLDAAALPSGRVIVQVVSFCRLACAGPSSETLLPLDWGSAAPLFDRALPPDRHELALGFRWFDRPYFMVARWAADAPSSDIAAIPEIARSLRPDPAPLPGGEYRGWFEVGPVSTLVTGSVRSVVPPAGATSTSGRQIWPFYLVIGKQNVFAFASRPPYDHRCDITYDAATDLFSCDIDGRTLRWTRFGRHLGPEPASGMSGHRVIVRDGMVWVYYEDSTAQNISAEQEAAER